MTRESILKKNCKRRLEKAGWLVIHLIQTNCNGINDTLVIRAGRHVWIEFKRPGEEPRPLQDYRHDQLKKHGAETRVVHYESDIDDLCGTPQPMT